MRNIQPLVEPKSIAVIGASANVTKSGGILFSNLASGGFTGPLYPINPNASDVLGKRAYPRLSDVPEKVDLVYIVLPSHHAEAAIDQCIEAGARAACIITAGFSEAGPEGAALEQKLRDKARNAGLLLAGPNTIGMVNAECKMMGSFVNFPRWERGGISLFTQTGIFTGAVMLQIMNSPVQRLPVSKSIDVGNKIDVDELDFLYFAERDEETKVIGLYIESIREPEKFFKKASELRTKKPIVILKPGRTTDGQRASAAHTGSPPSNALEIEKELRKRGILIAEDEEDFVNGLRALAMLPRPKGKRVGIATTSGALGVMATDLSMDAGLKLAEYSEDSISKMRSILPEWLIPSNPFDFWIGIDVRGARAAHEIGLEAVFSDPGVDLVLCTLLAPPNADFPEMGDLLKKLRKTYDKPVAMVLYGAASARWTMEIEGANIPVFSSVRAGTRALGMIASLTDS